MASFSVPYVASNPDSWGPPETDDANPNAPGNVAKFAALPYAPFGRSDRLGRAADFTGGNRGYGNNYGGFNRRNQRDFRGRDDEGEPEETFQLVDTSKTVTTKRFVNPASKRRQHSLVVVQVPRLPKIPLEVVVVVAVEAVVVDAVDVEAAEAVEDGEEDTTTVSIVSPPLLSRASGNRRKKSTWENLPRAWCPQRRFPSRKTYCGVAFWIPTTTPTIRLPPGSRFLSSEWSTKSSTQSLRRTIPSWRNLPSTVWDKSLSPTLSWLIS
jgi:hypothetical protein